MSGKWHNLKDLKSCDKKYDNFKTKDMLSKRKIDFWFSFYDNKNNKTGSFRKRIQIILPWRSAHADNISYFGPVFLG